jgi:hypothetical protein
MVEKLAHASKVLPMFGFIPGLGKLICCCPPDEMSMLPLATAAAAGVARGLTKEATGTRSEPKSAATTTRVTCVRNPSRNFFLSKDNMLNT